MSLPDDLERGRRLREPAGGERERDLQDVDKHEDGRQRGASGLAEPTPAFELVWQIHAAAFALALPMLGTTCIGSALAAHASGLTPAWQRLLGMVGGSLLLAAGLGNLAIADGSPLIFVGLLGFVAWLVWLLATGVRLVRS